MLFQFTGVIYTIKGVSRKTGNLLGDNQIKVAVLCARYHTVKLFTLLCIRARNALIGKNLIKLPIGIALNILSEIPLLAFKRIGLVFIVR